MKDVVIIVWDSKGKFFQAWTDRYNGDGIEHGKRIAEYLGGTHFVVDKIDKDVKVSK